MSMGTRWIFLLGVATGLAGCSGGEVEPDPCDITGQQVVFNYCLGCHSGEYSEVQRSGAPLGVNFDTDGDVRRNAAGIRDSVMVRKTMPPGVTLAECEVDALDAYLKQLEAGPCLPSCSGRPCGDDGCGGSCGSCAAGENCEPDGQCVAPPCTPSCAGKLCGDDGCGGTCGTCPDGLTCAAAQQCVCVPSCANRECGDDGCGGSCGECNDPSLPFCRSDASSASCVATCTPDCSGRVCGDDGCGGRCAPDDCPAGQTCSLAGQCVCTPNCAGRTCGDDGCGGSCGTCSTGMTCEMGQCTFTKNSYAADVHPILGPTCGAAGCHRGGPNEPLDFRTATSAYQTLVNKPSTQCASKNFVVPFDIPASYLVNKLTGSGMCFGTRMPKGGTALTNAELDIVRAWIATGADP